MLILFVYLYIFVQESSFFIQKKELVTEHDKRNNTRKVMKIANEKGSDFLWRMFCFSVKDGA